MPRFVTNDDGSVELDVTFDGVSDEEASSMSFLESSAYKAFWSWSGGFDHVMSTANNAVDIVSMFTFNNGTDIYANIVGKAFA